MGGGAFGPIPAMTNGMTYQEVGSSGLRAFAGYDDATGTAMCEPCADDAMESGVFSTEAN